MALVAIPKRFPQHRGRARRSASAPPSLMLEHSVLIYARNHAPFIAECVDSVLAQTEPPGEIIVVDDRSDDGTRDLLRAYGEKIRLISAATEPRPGHVAKLQALQTAFAAARGRVVFLLDGDDRFKPDKIARYTAAFENYPDASVVQAPLERIDFRGASLGANLEPRYHVANHLREIYRQHDLNLFYPLSSLAFSRYYLERILPLDLADGLPLWTEARLCVPAAYYGRIVTLLDPLTDWRCHTPADALRTRPDDFQLRQFFLRTRAFNQFCRRHRLRTISPWRSQRLYLHLLRYVVPPRVFNAFARRLRPLLGRLIEGA